jgi:hypothetical protein
VPATPPPVALPPVALPPVALPPVALPPVPAELASELPVPSPATLELPGCGLSRSSAVQAPRSKLVENAASIDEVAKLRNRTGIHLRDHVPSLAALTELARIGGP